MASGDTLIVITPAMMIGPASNFAQFVARNNHLLLAYDDTTQEDAYFPLVLPRNYAATTGVTITIVWLAATATTGNVVWETAFERHQDDATDLDADSFATGQTVTAGAASASGEPSYDTRAHTDGAQMDSIAVGESGRLRVRRVAADAGDTMTGDAQLLRIEIRET